MKVLVFGATGSVGKQLVSQALDQGHEVTALVRGSSRHKLADSRLNVIEGDVLDYASVERAVKGADAVISAIGTLHGAVNSDMQ